MREDLASPELFGNEAGEDESPEVLSSYFLEKEDFSPFFQSDIRFSIVKSRKGMGKSALLSELAYRRRKSAPDEIIVYLKAADLVSLVKTSHEDPNELINGWQQRICSRINLEVGRLLNVGFSDDSIRLIERAEITGFRGRNLVGTLVDRLRVKLPGFDVSRTTLPDGNEVSLLQRLSKNGDLNVWLLVDDIDATFLNTPKARLAASTFFTACRYLVGAVSGLNIRASVRSDVWTLLRQYDESLDKCEQYIVDIQWSTKETGVILGQKLHSYFMRQYNKIPDAAQENIFLSVFPLRFEWAGHLRRPHEPIHILANGRPRWASSLCRLAAMNAYKMRNATTIGMGNIENIMPVYGAARLSDLYKEHRHQCKRIEVLIETFAGCKPLLTTTALLDIIKSRLLVAEPSLSIDGNDGVLGEVGVAHFLYRIGFIDARDPADDEHSLRFTSFDDRPTLLTTTLNLDDGLRWEIHPSYRVPLRIRK